MHKPCHAFNPICDMRVNKTSIHFIIIILASQFLFYLYLTSLPTPRPPDLASPKPYLHYLPYNSPTHPPICLLLPKRVRCSISLPLLSTSPTMPNKYSHGLVFSQQQRWPTTDTAPPSPLKPPPSAANSKSHTRSAVSSMSSVSGYSAQDAVISDYIRVEPDPDQEPSFSSERFTYAIPLDPPPVGLASPKRSRPSSVRLRLESPFGFRSEDSPSSPPRREPHLTEHSHDELPPSPRPNVESSPQERLRLVDPDAPGPRSPRPSLLHKSSSIETQIYAPERPISPPPTREGQNLRSVDTTEPYPSTPAKQERQHVCAIESPQSSWPSVSTGDRQERSSSETWRANLPSPTRNRQQISVQKSQTLGSPQPGQVGSPDSAFGTENSHLSSSTRDPHDWFSLEEHGSQATSSARGDRQRYARSPLPTPSRNSQDRPSLDMQRMQPPPVTQKYQYRPYLEARYFSSESQPQTTLKSAHGRRQSFDTQPPLDPRDAPSPGPRRISLDQTIDEIQHSRSQSINSNIAQDRQARSSSGSRELSLEQFIQESKTIREALVDSQTYSFQMSSLYADRFDSRQQSLADAQRYTPKNPSVGHTPRSRRDRRSKLPDTFASHHNILLPTPQGAYDNVSIETHGFPPERPPSPPATPGSGNSFSPAPQAEESQRTRPPPLVPQRNARRSLSRQGSILRSTSSSIAELALESPRPKTAPAIDVPTNLKRTAALHSPTFSISTRISSVNATRSPPSVNFSNFSDAMTSPRQAPFEQPKDKGYFDDAELESLPSEIDFNVLPYENPNVGPAIFRAGQLGLENPISPRYEDPNTTSAFVRATQLGIPDSQDEPTLSRTSSFDSAAPPPIGLNRRISHATAEPHQAKMPKKESKLSLLSLLRSTHAPKAVLYSEATQGRPPASVSVSRTGVPSIPTLFPGYRGQFPPSQRTRNTGPRMRPGLDPKRSALRSPAHMDAVEKRKSWVKGDEVVDKNHRASHLLKKREFERILNSI